MRSSHSSLALAFALLLSSSQAWCQATPAPTPTPTTAGQAAASPSLTSGQESRTERIRVEDEGARIDELRIGGETRTISVTPKGGMPAYDVAPKTGERTWKVLGF
ncbi:MAG: hypothetical protein KA740_12665 [Rhodoferax sp.]|nr:hypothetical protein [Rhodoferax sp.]